MNKNINIKMPEERKLLDFMKIAKSFKTNKVFTDVEIEQARVESYLVRYKRYLNQVRKLNKKTSDKISQLSIIDITASTAFSLS